jgi:DNA-binding Lrp family transcriptional regulator
MPKILGEGRKRQLKLDMLRFLSVDGKMSIDNLSRKLGLPKTSTYNLFLEVTKEYGIHFVPEINIENVWKYEFLKLNRKHKKREIIDRTLEKMQELGFTDYIALFKFVNKIPSEEKIIKAIGDSYIPQFVAKMHGEYDLVIYAVGRNYPDIDRFMINFKSKLKGYPVYLEINNIWKTYGFFPLRNELIKEFDISSNYSDILLQLNKNAREGLSALAENANTGYIFEKLKRTNMLDRITYYEKQPKNVINGLVQIKILDEGKFITNRNRWLLHMIKDYLNKHNEYTFMCDTSAPYGILIFVNFENGSRIEDFLNIIRKALSGVDIKYTTISKVVFGSLGIRNFDMEETLQYKTLEMKKLV